MKATRCLGQNATQPFWKRLKGRVAEGVRETSGNFGEATAEATISFGRCVLIAGLLKDDDVLTREVEAGLERVLTKAFPKDKDVRDFLFRKFAGRP